MNNTITQKNTVTQRIVPWHRRTKQHRKHRKYQSRSGEGTMCQVVKQIKIITVQYSHLNTQFKKFFVHTFTGCTVYVTHTHTHTHTVVVSLIVYTESKRSPWKMHLMKYNRNKNFRLHNIFFIKPHRFANTQVGCVCN